MNYIQSKGPGLDTKQSGSVPFFTEKKKEKKFFFLQISVEFVKKNQFPKYNSYLTLVLS